MKKLSRIGMTSLLISIMLQSMVFAEDSTSYGQISSSATKILNAIAWVGYAVAFGMIIYIGIKYTMAAANEKANLKQGVINYLIGACLIICASAIANIVAGVASGGGSDIESMASGLVSAAQNAAQ